MDGWIDGGPKLSEGLLLIYDYHISPGPSPGTSDPRIFRLKTRLVGYVSCKTQNVSTSCVLRASIPTLRPRSSKAERQANARSEALESDKMVKTHDWFFGGENDCDMFVLPEKQTNFLMNMKFVFKKQCMFHLKWF